MKEIEIKHLMESLDLGSVVKEPIQVTGGLLHKMFRVYTDKGTYAVKVLNPEIMKRPAALQNTVNSEMVAAAFQTMIPVVVALEINGKQIHELDGAHYMIFDWVEGASIFPPMITPKNCSAIGQVLGKIHHTNLMVDGVSRDNEGDIRFEWDKYAERLQEYGTEDWIARLQETLSDIQAWNQSACDAQVVLSKTMVISHCDLDLKNVMWNGDTPWIID